MRIEEKKLGDMMSIGPINHILNGSHPNEMAVPMMPKVEKENDGRVLCYISGVA
jgi:hypothetical protein